MDENFLLTLETLSLNREITRGVSARGVFAIKNRDSGTYLVVNDAQLAALEAFRMQQTVPQMLGRAIHRRTCLELSEFYELIVKAHHAGVLTSESTLRPPPAPPALKKSFPFPTRLATGWASLAIAGFIGMIALRPPSSLPTWIDALVGWVIFCVALSVGELAAALALRTAGGEPVRARFIWASVCPRYHVDLSDACMRDLSVRVAVALLPLTPLLTASAVGLAFFQGWAFVPTVASLVLFHPRSQAVDALRLLLGRLPRLDTEQNFLFSGNRWPRRRLRAFLKIEKGWAIGWYIGGGLLWIWMAVRFIYSTAGISLSETWVQPLFWQGVAAIVIGSVGLTGFIILTSIAAVAVRRRGARIIAQTRRRARRWRSPKASVLTEDELITTLGISPLFRTLDRITQAALAERLGVATHPAWTTLVTSGSPSGHVSVIAKGSARATRRFADGRKVRVQNLVEGDVLGAQELLDPDTPAFDVESRTPVVALTLSYKDFEETVVQRLGRERTHRLAHHCSFLRSLHLCANWQLTSIARLAELADVRHVEVGTSVVNVGSEPWLFFVVWEGELEVKRHGRVLARMGSGDFFGEVDLLQNSAAIVEVAATRPSRLLCVQRTDFLRFVTHNHRVALSLEQVASKRLGRPIFPLQASFETN
ncbi:MAG: cyclic nucleotide-binding domain-containing protein [Opitutaceae bacterium]